MLGNFPIDFLYTADYILYYFLVLGLTSISLDFIIVLYAIAQVILANFALVRCNSVDKGGKTIGLFFVRATFAKYLASPLIIEIQVLTRSMRYIGDVCI